MKIRRYFFIVGLIIAFSSSLVNAQDEEKKGSKLLENVSVNANLGTLLFYGDVSQYDYYPVTKYNSEWGFGGGLFVEKTLNSTFGLRGQFLTGSVKGTNRKKEIEVDPRTGLDLYNVGNWKYFNADIAEFSVSAIINLSNLLFVTKDKRKTTLYGTIGYGLVNFRTELFDLRTKQRLGSYGYDGDEKVERTSEVVIPLGFGVKYKLSTNLDLSFETSMRNANTDKLDALVSDGSAKDKYGYTSLGVSYKFGAGEDKESLEWQSPFEAINPLGDSQASIDGMTKDSDYDGVADFYDKEPDTPEGVPVDGSGKALDVDNDGIPDYLDAEPFSTKGAKVDENGLEIDTDGDGIPDSRDLEPNTAEGKLVNFQGIAIVGQEGAVPESTVKSTSTSGASASFLPSIYFAVNSTSISNVNMEKLAVVAQILKENSDMKVKIVGHCDNTGSVEYNINLSKRRSQSVIDQLVKVYDLDSSRFVLEFNGKSKPLAKGLNYINRRVDFIPVK